MKIPGTYPKSAFTRVKQQTRVPSRIFSSQQEVIVEAFTGAALDTYLLTHPFGVAQVRDNKFILPYTTVEFIFTTVSSGLLDTPYACHIVISPSDVQGTMAIAAATQINAWARAQGVLNPNLLSLHAVAKVVNFAYTVVIQMPWGMLGAADVGRYLPVTQSFTSFQALGSDHPFMIGVRGGKFSMFEVNPHTPYQYYYPYGTAPYFYYQ